VLSALGCGEIVDGHMMTGLEPRHTSYQRYVEENTSTDDAVARHVYRKSRRAGGCECVDADIVIELAVVDDLTQSINVAVGVAVHVHGEPIHREIEPCITSVIIGAAGHLVSAGLGVVC
jgi:hypothetical protein